MSELCSGEKKAERQRDNSIRACGPGKNGMNKDESLKDALAIAQTKWLTQFLTYLLSDIKLGFSKS